MADSPRNSPKILRSWILYEVLHGKSVEVAYKNVCKAMGDNVVEFLDFEYWYYHFYHGNKDLNYDKERDPNLLLFSELPEESIKKVIEKLYLKEQLNFRKVSHGFRNLVDEQKPAYKIIEVSCRNDYIKVHFNRNYVEYTDKERTNMFNDEGITMHIPPGIFYIPPIIFGKPPSLDEIEKVIKSDGEESFVEKALNDLAIALKNPKVNLESLCFDYDCEKENEKKIAMELHDGMINLLKTFNHKISVNSLIIIARSQEDVLIFMSFLKPGNLDKIQITFVHESLSPGNYLTPKFVNIDKIATLDQWKQAKHVKINVPVSAPIESFSHFKSFDVQLVSDVDETLIYLKDTLPNLAKIPDYFFRVDIGDYETILGPFALFRNPRKVADSVADEKAHLWADSLRNDPQMLRSCILFEVLCGNSVDKAYKNVCKVMGDDAIEFLDLDFWYHRFYQGNHDLDYDKGRDSKSLLFSDLPADAIGKVVEKLELKEQLNLRKTSHGFRVLVDEQKLAYKTIGVKCRSDHILVKFNRQPLPLPSSTSFPFPCHLPLPGYQEVAYTDTKSENEEFLIVKVIKSIGEESFVERALNDLSIAIKNPKVKLESLHFFDNKTLFRHEKIATRMYEGMRNLLKSLDHKISVKSISMYAKNQENVSEMLSYLKPGHLEKIDMSFFIVTPYDSDPPEIVNIDKIITMDQWKMAKHVRIDSPVDLPIDTFFHFKSFDIELKFFVILDSDLTATLIYLRDTLPKLAEIPHCILRIGYDPNIEHYKGILGLEVTPNMEHRYSKIFHYPIPGSVKPLYFEFGDFYVSIYRDKLYKAYF